jgi:DNA modification methylase
MSCDQDKAEEVTWRIREGDCRAVLAELESESVQCVVTSPPYWGLRDYGTALWEGSSEDCDHIEALNAGANTRLGLAAAASKVDGRPRNQANRRDNEPGHYGRRYRAVCGKCGARRVDSQLGLEPTPEEYVTTMVGVFREVRRVLRKDGTLWLNMGDSYWNGGGEKRDGGHDFVDGGKLKLAAAKGSLLQAPSTTSMALKPKDLVGIPWRLAFALQADGWVLRSEIIWSKPNPMPESVTDRPTKAHETVFLLSKGKWIGPEPGRFADISDEDARWLAMFFDTEGNVVIKRAEREDGRRQYGAQVAFANTNRRLVETAQAIVGMGSIHERPGTNAPMFYWQMAGQQARDLLYRIYPFLIVKPRQARVAIHMQDTIAEPKQRPGRYRTDEHSAFLERCWMTVKELNHFGEPDLAWVPEPRYGRWTAQPYYYDADAVREPHTQLAFVAQIERQRAREAANGEARRDAHFDAPEDGVARLGATTADRYLNPAGRNLRSVWNIATEPFPEAHFATFPKALVEPCIKAGTSEKGCCPECGAAWVRMVEDRPYPAELANAKKAHGGIGNNLGGQRHQNWLDENPRRLLGWNPTCNHDFGPTPCTVLDPFAGSGTVGLVALRLGRSFIGIELSPTYAEMARDRIRWDAPLFNVETETHVD